MPPLNPRSIARPTVLYKYRALDGLAQGWIADTIVRHKIYCPPVSTFNDPFDSIPSMATPKTPIARERLAARVMRDVGSPPPNVTRGTIAALFAGANSLVTQAAMQEQTRAVMDMFGMYCLTEDPASVLMWAHYGQSHGGIAFGFRTGEGSPFDFALPIHYHRDRPLLRPGAKKAGEMIAALTTKADFWAYEREWRFFSKPGEVGIHTIPSDCLVEIVLGARTPAEMVRQVKAWNAEREHPAAIKRATIDPFAFRLHIEPEG